MLLKIIKSCSSFRSRTLFCYCSNKPLSPINVIYSPDTPMVYYNKNRKGEYIVQLTAQNNFWCQYTYQFSHEFCHILSNYNYNEYKDGEESNKWFEESLCEMCSLFTLRKMGETWQTHPPFQSWKDYSTSLTDYASNIIEKNTKKIEGSTVFIEWFQDSKTLLRNKPHCRDKNTFIARTLLPFIEGDPRNWRSICYLNLGDLDSANSFESYLENWLWYAPDCYGDFIKKIANIFGVSF